MTSLVVCIGEGKGTWGHAIKVIEDQEWENIFVITQEYFKDKFKVNKHFSFIIINMDKNLEELIEIIKTELNSKIFGDVALNIISGTGKEHMATIAALLKIGAGIRLIALTKEGLKEV